MYALPSSRNVHQREILSVIFHSFFELFFQLVLLNFHSTILHGGILQFLICDIYSSRMPWKITERSIAAAARKNLIFGTISRLGESIDI